MMEPPCSHCCNPYAIYQLSVYPRRSATIVVRFVKHGTRALTTEDFERWRVVDEQATKLETRPTAVIRGLSGSSIIDSIAQSVYCSSAIEGEEIHRKDIEIAIVGQAHDFDPAEPEAKSRANAIHDIYTAYIWALSRPFPLSGGQHIVVTPEFIRELHRIMFQRTKGDSAGAYKAKDNSIRRTDGVILAYMLPHEKVPEFMDALCDRINARFLQALRHGSVSKLLSIAEFVCDFLAIHPFPDGNGRLARLLSTYLLDRADYLFARFYSLDAVILERHSEYYSALLAAQRAFYGKQENLTPWVEYYIDCVYTQWIRAYQYIKAASTRD